MSEKKKIPEIRFSGFEDEWEEKRLGDIAEFSKGNGYSKEDLVNNGSEIMLYGTMYTDYKTDIYFTNKFVFERKNSVKSTGKEVVIPSSGETAIDIARASAVKVKDIVLGGDLNIVYPNDKIDNSFLALSLTYGERKKELIKRAQGASIIHIKNDDLKESKIVFPEIAEQKKISNLISNIDNVINQLENSISGLQSYKQSMLQKMFPIEGEKVPEIRFEGFEGEWEEKKLLNFTRIRTGKLDANAMIENGEYDFYTSGIKKFKIDSYEFEGPAITIAGNGATVGYMHLADGKFNAYQRTYVLDKFNCDRLFIYQIIKNKLPKKIHEESRAGSIPYIVMEMLTDLIIEIPTVKEQLQIGLFFQSLENQIDTQQRKLEAYKNLKRTLLDKIFI